MEDFALLVTHEIDLSYVLRGHGPLASCSMTVQFRDVVTEDGVHVGTVIDSSFATFPQGSGVIVTRLQDEVFVKDCF